ncbi:methyl-accepting chemotaxis protein [Alkaliphilus sp. B6464]|uniref:methyl-accepting chemotaxis protein n=1 Tax=Alkaliphilus sp. B6464 TaxID=2731219 RepID=UPI001BA9AA52|nr:methyl-accepting chemotaxis protein [Alkaliphilus sp. B6464]QUH21922.1 methyl-accepting chemotaxis protein [Alkaliphilus sp. B6464]
MKKKEKVSVKFKFNSVRSRLMISLVCMSIFAIGSVGIINYIKSFNILQQKLAVTSSQTLGYINTSISNYLVGVESQAAILSELPILKDTYHYNVSREEIDVVSSATVNESIDTISSATVGAKDSLIGVFKEIEKINPNVKNVFFSIIDKTTIIYPEVDLSRFDPTTRTWYQLAIKDNGKAVWIDPYKDITSGDIIVTVSKAVIDNGKIIGVVGLDVDLKEFSKNLSSLKIGEEGYVYVADSNGIALVHPNEKIVGTDDPKKSPIWTDVLMKGKGFVNYNYKGAKRLGIYETNEKTGWKIISSIPEEELLRDTKILLTNTIFIGLTVILITMLFSFFISKSIGNNIRKLLDSFNKASEGDLTVSTNFKSIDEFGDLGKSFNKMIHNIRELMLNVRASSKIVAQTSDSILQITAETNIAMNDIAATIQEVATGTHEQARDIDMNSNNISELAREIEEITRHTFEVDKLSNNAKILGYEGLGQVKILVDKTERTGESTKKVNEIILEMKDSADEINSITETINQIADQTNLLALNAAIEAARAGEAGRGFSVVADEVRKLAEQSSKATQNISNLISNMNDKTNEAVNAMKQSKTSVDEQVVAVDLTKGIFDKILNSVQELDSKVTEIKESTIEMDNKKNQIVDNTQSVSVVSEEISASTQEVSASAEEIAATTSTFVECSENLKQLSDELIQQMNSFKL